MSKLLTYLVIHVLDTPEGREVSGAEVRRWHILPKPHGRGWKQVGYSDLIHLGGTLENLVPYDNDNEVDAWEITNGVRGVNGISRHVALPGGRDKDFKYHKDTRTKEQRTALMNYVRMTIAQHPEILVAGHYQFDPLKKYCPGFNVPEWLRAIKVPERNIYELQV